MTTKQKETDMNFASDLKSLNEIMSEIREKCNQRVFQNKRLWRYVFFYFALFGVTYKICNPWYQLVKKGNPKELQKIAENLNVDARDYDVIGKSGHRPAELMIALANSIICSIRAYAYSGLNKKRIIQSLWKENNDHENECLDIHLAFWFTSTLLWLKNPNKLILLLHHILGIAFPVSTRVINKAGRFGGYMAFWSESITWLMSAAGLLRIFHELKAPKQLWIKNVSNALFTVFIILMAYVRVVLFSKACWPMLEYAYKSLFGNNKNGSEEHKEEDEDVAKIRHSSPKWYLFQLFLSLPVVLAMGYWWAWKGLHFMFVELKAQLQKH